MNDKYSEDHLGVPREKAGRALRFYSSPDPHMLAPKLSGCGVTAAIPHAGFAPDHDVSIVSKINGWYLNKW